MKIRYILLSFTLTSASAIADNSTLDAAIGDGIGGAAGAAIGNEAGGRDGAIIGGVPGGAIGAAVNTDDKPGYTHKQREMHYVSDYSRYNHPRYRSVYPQHVHPRSRFCPPGLANKRALLIQYSLDIQQCEDRPIYDINQATVTGVQL